MDIHLNYEQAKEYPLKWVENQDVPFSWRVEKMRLTPDRTEVIVNESLTLSGIPQECYQYRLGNRVITPFPQGFTTTVPVMAVTSSTFPPQP